MLTRVRLVLLSWIWTCSRGQVLDEDRWASPGLCRYGNSVECCWGWRLMDGGRCQPHCQQGCKHGECVGPDRCKCHPGYSGKSCNQDLNECGVKPRPCKHRCMNTPGSYKCYCQDGYTLQGDGSCRNARTCYHANCQYGCEVSKGRVRCTCPSPGLQLGPDKRTCVDIDECVSARGVCPRHRKCVNTFGSFLCKCHPGFRLTLVSGRYLCLDKDTRPFCSLNPSSPKCRCKGGGCTAVPKVTLEPRPPRTTTPTGPGATNTAAAPPPSSTTTHLITMATRAATAPPDTTTTTTNTPTTTNIPTTTPTTTPSTTTAISTSTNTPFTTFIPTATTTSPTTQRTIATAAEEDTTTPATPAITTTTTTPYIASTTTPVTTALQTTATTAVSMVTTTWIAVTHKQRGDVHIPRHPDLNQLWEFDIELGNTVEDAGDDPEAAGVHCTFDLGLCDWLSDREGDLPWETNHKAADGRYLSVPELKAGQRSIRGARLAIQVTPAWSHSDLCFSFSHWLTGHHVGVLQLFIRKRGRAQRYGHALWSRTGGHGWRHTQVTLTTHSLDRVLLKAERKQGRRGQIAVDDVILRQGACR